MQLFVDVDTYHHWRVPGMPLDDDEERTGKRTVAIDGREVERVITRRPSVVEIRLPDKEILDVMAQNIFRGEGPMTFSSVLEWYVRSFTMPQHVPHPRHVGEIRSDHPAVARFTDRSHEYELTPGEQKWLEARLEWYRANAVAAADIAAQIEVLRLRDDLTRKQESELAAPLYEQYAQVHIPWDDAKMDALLGEEVSPPETPEAPAPPA